MSSRSDRILEKQAIATTTAAMETTRGYLPSKKKKNTKRPRSGFVAFAVLSTLSIMLMVSWSPAERLLDQSIDREEEQETQASPHRTGIFHSRRNEFLENTTLLSTLTTSMESCLAEKKELLSILHAASTTKSSSRRNLNRPSTQHDMIEQCPKLPTWKQVTDLYGNEPVILGMDTCDTYRKRLAAENITQPKVRIAGNFNSGTTVFSKALTLNFRNADRNRGIHHQGNYVEFDVPWGKHVPPKYKWLNKHPVKNPESPEYAFPIVIVRDPYRWMNSMCKESYDAVWDREKNRCPNLVRKVTDPKGVSTAGQTYPLHVKYQQTQHKVSDPHASLSDYWGDWIRNYYDSNEPGLIVRFEDLLFHAEDLMYTIAECVGLEEGLTSPYKYVTMPSKRHGQSSGFFDALTKYGHEISSSDLNMTLEDLEYTQSWTPSSRQGLDAELMAAFHYRHPGGNAQPASA